MKKIIILISLAYPLSAYAVLGESANSVLQDQQMLSSHSKQNLSLTKLKSRLATNDLYTKYTVTDASGITINEYSANNKIFAVSWAGPYNPDLNQLLGKYFPAIKQAKPVVQNLRMRYIQESDLVVHIFGIMGNFNGLAYVPSLMPPTLVIEELK